MNLPYRRAVLGIALAIGMLGALPVAVFAAQPSCGQTLTANTTLTANLDCSGFPGDNALNIGANGITVNLNGKTILGPAGYDNLSGIDTQGYNRTTVTNGTIRDYTYGVYSYASNRTTASYLTIDGNDTASSYGIYQSYGVNSVYNHLTVVDTYDAVYMEYNATTKVMNSNLTASNNALYNYDTTANVVSNNTLHGNYGVYEYESNRNSYTGNTANNGSYGFYLQCDGYGNVFVNGNTANNNSNAGFYVYECYYVDHPVDGYIGSRIVNNIANGNDYGFEDYYSYNELWRMNTANDNDSDGFYFDYPSNHRIVSNTALRNDSDGFEIQDNYSYYNVEKISSNTARRNGSYGFYAGYGAPGSDNIARLNSTANCYNVDC